MSDSNPRYSLAHRVRLCLLCGATMDAPLEGGDLTCGHCSTTVQVPPRTLDPLGTHSGAGVDDEVEPPQQRQERLTTLRKQAQNYNPGNPYATVEAPEGYKELTALPNDDQESLKKVLAVYREAYQRCEQRPTPQYEQAVYWLTWKLDNIYVHLSRSVQAWGVIQTSMDLLTNPGYQHGLRAKAGNKARKAGEYDSAEAWLRLCDPAPTILDLDTEYRTTLGMLHLARGQWDRALALVGAGTFDVPYEPASRLVVRAIRVAALEKLGRGAEAEEAMRELQQVALGNEATLRLMLDPSSVFAPARPAWARVKQADGSSGSLGEDDEMVPPGRKLLIIAGILGLLAVWTTHCGIDKVRTIMFERSWKSAKGRIEKVRTSEWKKGNESRIGVGVIFTYRVNGKTYRGNQVRPGQEWREFSSDKDAAAEAAKLRARREVTIYYNPKKPSQAALEQGWAGLIVVTVVTWLFTAAVLLAVFFLIRAYRRRHRAHEQWKAREARPSADGAGD